MEIIAYLFLTIGWIWFVVAAYSEGFWWALGCFFIPIVSLVFLIMHFDKAKVPFFVQMIGFALLVFGT